MSIASDVSRIKSNITAALAAIADKGVTVPDGSTSDALASLIASIEAGGGAGIELPTGYKVSTGTYTPNTEGTDVLHEIKIASNVPYTYPCKMFCIYRDDGFDASGSDANRYLTFYAGAMAASVSSTVGGCIYRNYATSGSLTGGGGVESSSTKSYGLPLNTSVIRSNCYVRKITSAGVLTFSTYGIVTLESGKTYKWFALLPSDAEV